jgi:histidyl-tRNA synthetase
MNMMADAEIIAIGYDFINEMGITDVELQINSVGCPECRGKHRDALRKFLEPKYDELCPTCQERFHTNPMRILDCKSPIDQELVKDAPMMLDFLCDDCREAFEQLKANLDAFGIKYVVNPKIVRGLDYYTKTAFEFVTTKIGAQGTVCGGGRYDGLISQLGGAPTPAIGFAAGIERLLMVMENSGVKIPDTSAPEVYLAGMDEQGRKTAFGICAALRAAGVCAETDHMARSVKAQFKYADKINAKFVAVIGSNELETGIINLKDMSGGEQKQVALDKLVEFFQNKL